MLTVTQIAQPIPDEAVSTFCPNAASALVRVVDCFTHQGVAGATVTLTVEDGPSVAGSTDEKGWVKFASTENLGPGEPLEVTVKMPPGYGLKRPSGAWDTLTPRPGHDAVAELMLVPTGPIASDEIGARAKQVLEETKLIRMKVDGGANFGNQAAALALLRNLESAGYRGRTEVLIDREAPTYDTPLSIATRSTPPVDDAWLQAAMGRALGGKPQDGTTVLVERSLTDEEVSVEYLAKALHAEAKRQGMSDFAIQVTDGEGKSHPSEGWPGPGTPYKTDLTLSSHEEPSVAAKLKMLDPDFETRFPGVTWVDGDAFADPAPEGTLGMVPAFDGKLAGVAPKLKTSTVIGLQPFQWHPEDRGVWSDGKTTDLCLPPDAAYVIREEDVGPHDPSAVTKAIGGGPLADNVNAVLAGAVGGKLSLMTAYGIHNAHDSSTETTLNNLQKGLRQARGKGERTVLFAINKNVAATQASAQNEDNARTLFLDASDPGTRAALQRYLRGETPDKDLVVLHSAQAVPESAFLQLVDKSRYPVILEGANTANKAQNLGKPYLSVSTKTTPYVAVPGKDGHTRLKALGGELNDESGDGEALGKFFAESRDQGDAFGGYFEGLASQAHHEGQDQLKLALFQVSKAKDAPAMVTVAPPHEIASVVKVPK